MAIIKLVELSFGDIKKFIIDTLIIECYFIFVSVNVLNAGKIPGDFALGVHAVAANIVAVILSLPVFLDLKGLFNVKSTASL